MQEHGFDELGIDLFSGIQQPVLAQNPVQRTLPDQRGHGCRATMDPMALHVIPHELFGASLILVRIA
jgi:hypothetical protein